VSCATDCGACPPFCGNLMCDSNETCQSCPGDCGACPNMCGDMICGPAETCASCAQDCCSTGGCSHDPCTTGAPLDPSCDACADLLCNLLGLTFCCASQWDSDCVLFTSVYCTTCP
jgi:hypothetical protein